MKPMHIPNWWDSIRSITTFEIITTYCLIMLSITVSSFVLMSNGKPELGKELLIFTIGSFSGTAVGAIVAYHFKKENGKEIPK